jgi:TPP-dependent pyruvate/acetoin dehydrogenase alpha subunit
LVSIPEETEVGTKTELYTEIQVLERQYLQIKDYISGEEYGTTEAVQALREFKNTLNKISAHILTLYTLKGQKTKITWDSLLTNIDNAIETIQTSPHPNPRATIELSLKISDPKIEQIMSYLSTLKESLKQKD